MLPSLSHRAALVERMDEDDCCEKRLLRTVRQFSSLNRLVSRYRFILGHWVLNDMRRDRHRDYHLLDMGAGGCDIAAWLLCEARSLGLRLRVTACDSDARIVRYAGSVHAHTPGLTICSADVLRDDPAEVVDYVFANHFLHHLSDEQIVLLLMRWAPRVRRRLVFSDLRRSYSAYLGHALLSCFYPRSFIREDGLTSIRRGFRAEELLQLASQAGLGDISSVQALRPSRLVLVCEPKPAGAEAKRSA